VRALLFRALGAAVLVLAVLSLIAARRMRFEHAMLLAEVVELRDIAEKQNRLLWNHGLIPYLLPPRLAAAWWNVEDAVSLLETVGSWGTPGVPK
jgi:hypothetical protein